MKISKKQAVSISIFTLVAFFVSCANMSSPSGGAYDLEPPKVVSVSPEFNAKNVTKGKIQIVFDENIVIERPNEKVIITPPQRSLPVIRSVNNKITVELKDTLIPNTTYTIDFTDAVSDNNEKNIFEDFSYSFSTSDVVDTLAISGRVVTANNIEPVTGIYVGLHSNLNDTAFTTTKFERISKTNEKGHFTIRGIAPGRYKIYALEDFSRSYIYNNMNANVAFLDTVIAPSFKPDVRQDTIFKENKVDKKNKNDIPEKVVDTIVDVKYTRFIPDDIVLRVFTSDFKRRYMRKHERIPNRIVMTFGSQADMAHMRPLSFAEDRDWAIVEKREGNDSLVYWIKDPAILEMDTLKFAATYQHTDTLNVHQYVTDTLSFYERGRKKPDKKKKDKKKEEEIEFLEIIHNLKSSMDIYNDISLEFKEPTSEDLKKAIKLQRMVDTLYTDINDFEIHIDSLNPRLHNLKYKWKYNEEYKFSIDSAAIRSLYGLWNNTLEQKFKIRREDEYGRILIEFSGLSDTPAFVELLDKSDKPIRKVSVKKNAVLFRNVLPGEYYARIVFDENDNEKWDTGNFQENRQPEKVFYYDKPFMVRANWDNTEAWAVDTSDANAIKPLAITKNKPQKKESKQEQLENRDKKKDEEKEKLRKEGQQLGRGSGNMGNTGGDYPMYNNYYCLSPIRKFKIINFVGWKKKKNTQRISKNFLFNFQMSMTAGVML